MTIGFYYARPDIASQKNEPRKSNVLEPLFKEYWHCWQKKGHHQGALLGGMGCWIISWSLLYWGENLKHLLQKLSDIGSGEKGREVHSKEITCIPSGQELFFQKAFKFFLG